VSNVRGAFLAAMLYDTVGPAQRTGVVFFTDAVALTATVSAVLVIAAARVTAEGLRDVRSQASSTGEATP